MKIDNLKIKGFTSLRELDLAMSKLSLLNAPMGSGKSTVLNAISFAVQGHTRLGRTNAASGQLIGPSGLASVTVDLDDGTSWTRELVRNAKKGSVNQSISGMSKSPDDSEAEQSARLADYIGEFAEAHDLSELTGLSPDKKRDRILSLIGKAREASGNPLTGKSVAARIARLFLELKLGTATVQGIAEVWNKTPEELNIHLAGKLSAGDREAFETTIYPAIRAALDKPNVPIEERVGVAVESVNDIKNASKRQHDECQQAVNALTARKATITPSAKTVEQLTAERDALLKEREAAHATVKAAEGKSNELAAACAKLQKLKDFVNAAEREALSLTVGPDIQAADLCDSRIKDLAAQIAAMGDAETPIREARAAYELASAKFDATGTPATKAGQAASDAAQKVKLVRRELESLAGSPWQTALRLWRDFLAELEIYEVASKEGRAMESFLHEQAKSDYREKLTADLKVAIDKHAEAEGEFARIENERKAAYAAQQAALAVCQQAQNAYDNQYVAKREAQAEIDRLTREAASIRSQYESHSRRLDDATARKNRGELDLQDSERAVMQLERESSPAALMDARNKYADLDARVQVIDADLRTKVGYDQLVKELTATIANKESQDVLHNAAKVALECVKDVRDQLVGELVSPLLDRMNRFLSIAAPGCRAYCELDGAGKKTVFELGWIKSRPGQPDVAVPLSTMSGGETVIYSAALVYAMTMMADPPLKLLLLEVAEVDEWNWNYLAAGLEAVADEMSNIIVATSRVFPARPGWNVLGNSVFSAARERELVTA